MWITTLYRWEVRIDSTSHRSRPARPVVSPVIGFLLVCAVNFKLGNQDEVIRTLELLSNNE